MNVNPDECFLDAIFRFGLVSQVARQVIEKSPAMAVHQVIQGRLLARNKASHVLSVQLVGFDIHCVIRGHTELLADRHGSVWSSAHVK